MSHLHFIEAALPLAAPIDKDSTMKHRLITALVADCSPLLTVAAQASDNQATSSRRHARASTRQGRR